MSFTHTPSLSLILSFLLSLKAPFKRSLMNLTISASLTALSGCGYQWGATLPSSTSLTQLPPCRGFNVWRVTPSPLVVEPPERLHRALCLAYREAGGQEGSLSSLSASLSFTIRPLSVQISSYHAVLSVHESAQAHLTPHLTPHLTSHLTSHISSPLKEHVQISHPPQGSPPSQLNSKLVERLMSRLGQQLAAKLSPDVDQRDE